MNQQELYKKTDEIIARFNNGEKRYRESPTFNRVVQMLAKGVSPFDIIDSLVNVIDDTNNAIWHNKYKALNQTNKTDKK